MRLLGAKYKTYEGARKRAGFENGVAPSEYRRGYEARLYRYRVVTVDGIYRVAREVNAEGEAAFKAQV